MGLNMKERQAVTREYKPCYQKATRKEKKAMLDEFTRLALIWAGSLNNVYLIRAKTVPGITSHDFLGKIISNR